MKKTRDFNQVTKDFTIDQYLHQLVGFDVEEESLLYHACSMVWQLPTEGSMPNSLDVALLLSELGSDETTLIAALLSSTRLIKNADEDDIKRIFGGEIMRLVTSVIQLHEFHGERDESSPEQVERLRRMLLSMVDDIRAVLIKLAFRVQRLRQLSLASESEQQEIAQESLEIFAPIANRLGIGQLKWELEDIAFRIVEPQSYKRIAKALEENRASRETYIADFVADQVYKVYRRRGVVVGLSGGVDSAVMTEISVRAIGKEKVVGLEESLKQFQSDGTRVKTRFLANISHDIRTPMNAIIGFSHLLGEEDVDGNQRDAYINHITKNSNSLLNMMENLIDLTLIETGALKLNEEKVGIYPMMKELYPISVHREQQIQSVFDFLRNDEC